MIAAQQTEQRQRFGARQPLQERVGQQIGQAVPGRRIVADVGGQGRLGGGQVDVLPG